MGNSLYDLSDQYRELSDLATDPDTELTADMVNDTLAGIEGEFNEKAQRVGFVINNVVANVGVIDAEIKRLQERKRIIQNRDNALRDYLKNNMLATGINKIECPLFSITLVQGRERVVVDDADKLPDELVMVKTEVVADKKKILTVLKAEGEGEPIAGAHLERGPHTVRIK